METIYDIQKSNHPIIIPGIMGTLRAIRDANSLKTANMTREERLNFYAEGHREYLAKQEMNEK